ncbi:MAG: elongation factor P maturation arginine rhamnosyltransferase EarP [Ferrovum sp.]|jgi:hypothetical protein|nr:elongation factor P maturation arginine rhamnosyltransferase EarP [Ferrovum sp.]
MSYPSKPKVFKWHLFARVIDNFGDAGLAWRLARQLALDYQQAVVLFLDSWETLTLIEPRLVGSLAPMMLDGVTLLHWGSEFIGSPDIVLEVLGCRPPEGYLRQLIAQGKDFLWVDWEYLSAESWVESLHLTPSWQAEYHRNRYYFCPGFTPKTGGLLREKNLLAQQVDYRKTYPGNRVGPQRMLVFAYDLSPLWSLENAPEKPVEIWLLNSESCIAPLSSRWWVRPMVSQVHFDTYLWSCDLNAVRGEDSFVRAQWAGVPMLWQIYPQELDAHWVKLDAFLGHYLASASPSAKIAIKDLFYAWNGRGDVAPAWKNMLPHWREWQQLSCQWVSFLINQPDNGQQLMNFVGSMIS